jgi:hemolysin activation/secretion protein
MASKGVRYAKLGYVVPVTYGGLRMGANISKMSYKVVDGVDADGSSQSVGITATYPLIRSSMQSITLGSSLDRKIYNNTQALGSTDNKKVDVAAITLSGSKFDSYGQTQLGITLNGGKAYLDNQTVAKTYGGYTKLALNATRYQSVDETTSLSLSAQLQASNKNLDSSEKLYLGGSSGVRAYPSNEAGGDMGTLISAEATKSLPYGMSATLFYDYGYIVANKDNSQIKAHPNEYALGGAGASLAYAKGNFSAKATLAYRVGTNPNAQADGSDNDGTKKIPTVWFQINKGF